MIIRKKMILVIVSALAVALMSASFCIVLLNRDQVTCRTVQTSIAGRPAKVIIERIERPPRFKVGHQYLISQGEDKYDIMVEVDDGNRFSLTVSSEPRAVWFDSGKLAIACSNVGDDWVISRIDRNGKSETIHKKDKCGRRRAYSS